MNNIINQEELSDIFELDKCVNWIKENKYTKVCLQFPDSLLNYSVDISFYIDKEIQNKTFILGDTSYGSCCVDEVASKHVEGEAIIHFGHACLSKTNTPVLYILPKKKLNIDTCISNIKTVFNGDTLILYDSGYSHLRNELCEKLPEDIKYSTVVSEVIVDTQKIPCGPNCSLLNGNKTHTAFSLSRGFCDKKFQTVIYIGDDLFENFVLKFKDVKFYRYTEGEMRLLNTFQTFKKISYLIEKIKGSQKIGLIVGTLSVDRYLDAISHIKKLCRRRRKRLYIISVGKPTVAKLANFPEIDVFVIITCPETNYIDSKNCFAPMVGLLELELALNENRSWDNTFSKDFRDLLEGGPDFIEVPTEDPEEDLEVSLLTNKLQGISASCHSQEVALKPEMSLNTSSFSSRIKSWDGLELIIGNKPVVKAEMGRSGTSQGYTTENDTKTS